MLKSETLQKYSLLGNIISIPLAPFSSDKAAMRAHPDDMASS